ncbi:MAG: lytic transglycosylase domain-containing protein [Deltaproteobacteria bacterium]|nr:lytic transglycosylase domain-containing protein [Deltaproteobacteria bacterium]
MNETAVLRERLALVEARLGKLEAAQARTTDAATRIDSRTQRHDAVLATLVEADAWSEAAELGIAKAMALRHTGLAPRDEIRLAATIVREAHSQGLDPRLVAAVVEVESGFDRFAISPVGALGLMQLMPATANALSPGDGASRLFELEGNVALGCRYLATLVREFGGVDRALLAYNMGPAGARKALAGPRARELLAGYPQQVQRARKRMMRDSHEDAALARVEQPVEKSGNDAVRPLRDGTAVR